MTGLINWFIGWAGAAVQALAPVYPVLMVIVLIGFAVKPVVRRLPISEAVKAPLIRVLGAAHIAALLFMGLVAAFGFATIHRAGAQMEKAMHDSAPPDRPPLQP